MPKCFESIVISIYLICERLGFMFGNQKDQNQRYPKADIIGSSLFSEAGTREHAAKSNTASQNK